MHCVVTVQLCADTCIHLPHRTTRSWICVVMGTSDSMQSLWCKHPHCSGHLKILTEPGCTACAPEVCTDIHGRVTLLQQNLWKYTSAGSLQISWLSVPAGLCTFQVRLKTQQPLSLQTHGCIGLCEPTVRHANATL